MALIDISAELKGSSAAVVVPVRIISATASLTGYAASNVGRPPAQPSQQPVPEKAPGA